jgi:hypothetical protein
MVLGLDGVVSEMVERSFEDFREAIASLPTSDSISQVILETETPRSSNRRWKSRQDSLPVRIPPPFRCLRWPTRSIQGEPRSVVGAGHCMVHTLIGGTAHICRYGWVPSSGWGLRSSCRGNTEERRRLLAPYSWLDLGRMQYRATRRRIAGVVL